MIDDSAYVPMHIARRWMLGATTFAAIATSVVWVVTSASKSEARPTPHISPNEKTRTQAAEPASVEQPEPLRDEVTDLSQSSSIVDGVPARQQCDPASIPLPAIGGEPPSQEALAKLRMLAHSMSEAGMRCDMPSEIPEYSWASLSSLIDIQLDQRRFLADENMRLLQDEFQMRLSLGRYEIRHSQPQGSSDGGYVAWRYSQQGSEPPKYLTVTIRRGELPRRDWLDIEIKTLDRHIASLARSFFDNLSR